MGMQWLRLTARFTRASQSVGSLLKANKTISAENEVALQPAFAEYAYAAA